MNVYALVGVSGTGKSTRATSLAKELFIPFIIDDGILIYQGRKIAGYSAKYENNFVSAVKRATFLHPQHREEVQCKLLEIEQEDILILGTSKHMVEVIAERLHLPSIYRYIDINEVLTKKEREAAIYSRNTYGKHTIPLSPIEVRKDFTSTFIHSVGKIILKNHEHVNEEKTIVYPSYQKNRIYVYEKVFKKIVTFSIKDHSNVIRIKSIQVAIDSLPTVSLGLTLQLSYKDSIPKIANQIQEQIRYRFNELFNIDLYQCHIEVLEIHIIPL